MSPTKIQDPASFWSTCTRGVFVTLVALSLLVAFGSPAAAHHCKGAHASDPACDGDGGGGGGGGDGDGGAGSVRVDFKNETAYEASGGVFGVDPFTGAVQDDPLDYFECPAVEGELFDYTDKDDVDCSPSAALPGITGFSQGNSSKGTWGFRTVGGSADPVRSVGFNFTQPEDPSRCAWLNAVLNDPEPSEFETDSFCSSDPCNQACHLQVHMQTDKGQGLFKNGVTQEDRLIRILRQRTQLDDLWHPVLSIEYDDLLYVCADAENPTDNRWRMLQTWPCGSQDPNVINTGPATLYDLRFKERGEAIGRWDLPMQIRLQLVE